MFLTFVERASLIDVGMIKIRTMTLNHNSVVVIVLHVDTNCRNKGTSLISLNYVDLCLYRYVVPHFLVLSIFSL